MKTMTCKQLGGACDTAFNAASFEEIAVMIQQHSIEMFQKKNEAHLQARTVMQQRMQNQGEIQKWFDDKKKEFEELPENFKVDSVI